MYHHSWINYQEIETNNIIDKVDSKCKGWLIVFSVMKYLADLFGNTNVRLIVEFDEENK